MNYVHWGAFSNHQLWVLRSTLIINPLSSTNKKLVYYSE
jgi:hypothetical protein